ncbi:MAG TPA: hypothetical protein PKU97_22250, partial [Kofleriaceae bacterium]|nr:hypothetical protein [Kofleriaceae bacterium]
MASKLQARASLIWGDEVMGDVVLSGQGAVTLGDSARATFVVPDLGLPKDFVILRAGASGYVLTLGSRMRGTYCSAGEVKDIGELVRGAQAGEFRATPLGGRDWGVIELDDAGDLKLFYQLGDAPPALPKARTALELLLPALVGARRANQLLLPANPFFIAFTLA